MVRSPILIKLLAIVLSFGLCFTLASCTSPEADGPSILDEELDTLDTDPSVIDEDEGDDDDMDMEIGDEDIDDEDGIDEDDVEDIDQAERDSLEEDLGEDEFGEEDDDIDELAGSDDELDEDELDEDELDDEDDEIALDEDDEDEDMEDEEDDDELDIDDEDFDDEFAEDSDAEGDDELDDEFEEMAVDEGERGEKALAKELEGGGIQQYPQNAQGGAAFPEEIQQVQPNGMPPGAPGGQPPIVSVSKIDDSVSPPEPKMPSDDLGQPDPIVAKADGFDSGQNWVPVVKVKTDPFYRNGRLMNTVYLARPGDTVNSVAKKLFGDGSKSSMILDDNPHLDRGMDPGDKIYYTSPNDPESKEYIKTYYEDLDLKPSKYMTRQDDNMRRLGSKLLGFQEGWKEIWAINQSVTSKSVLPAGIELRYWTGDEQKIMAKTDQGYDQAPPQVVENTPPPMAPPIENMAPEPPTLADAPPIVNKPDIPDVPPQAAMVDDPALSLADPEPLPEVDVNEPTGSAAGTLGNDEDTMSDAGSSFLTVGIMAIVVMAIALLISIQIKNRREQSQGPPPSLEFTQV